MAYEQILTILLGAGVGVAVVLYAVRSRLFGASRSIVTGGSSIETFTVSSQSTSVSQTDAAPIPKVTATRPPVVEAPVAEFQPLSFAEAVSAGSSGAAIVPIDARTVSSALPSVTVGSQTARAARAQRAPRRSAGAPRAHKPRAVGQTTRTPRKALDEPAL